MKRFASLLLSATALVGAITLSGASATASTGDLPEAAQRTLTVASYNIHHAQGADGVLDLERIAQVLERTGADVIGLQEVDRHFGARSEHVDQAAWLADRLGMSYCYAANLDLDPEAGRTERRQYGTAILSAYPLSDCSNTPLPNHAGGEQRGLAQGDVTVRGTKIRFFNTHLTHQSVQGRIDQAIAINEAVGAAGMPAVLVGDLNAGPDSIEYGHFTELLMDVWPVVGEGPGYTFDSDNPIGRIDYVLTSEDVTPMAAEVVASLASDHMPVVAEVVLPHPSSSRH